jgi:hypothetical protein
MSVELGEEHPGGRIRTQDWFKVTGAVSWKDGEKGERSGTPLQNSPMSFRVSVVGCGYEIS